MPITVDGNGLLSGVSLLNYANGSLTSASIANNAITAEKIGYTGGIVAINTVRSSTRTSVPNSGTVTLFSGTFTKVRAATTLIAICNVYGCQYSSGNCGVAMNIDGTTWDYGCGYQYDGAWSSTLQVTLVTGTSVFTGVSAGSHTIGFGFKPFNAATSERPFAILNPNSSDDSRNGQFISSIVVYEVV